MAKFNRFRSLQSSLATLVLIYCLWIGARVNAQTDGPVLRKPDQAWAGQRIVSLKGFGDYFVLGEDGKPHVVRPEGLGVNIVAVVQRIEGKRIWIKANGQGDAPVGWVDTNDAILLDDAIPYFTASIERDPTNWDSYLRRAESEHASNQHQAAISDFSTAIKLRPDEPFLYLRRGREFRILKECDKAAGDFENVIRLKPDWPEPYNLEAGVYTDCPDPQYRNPAKAIALMEDAIALDLQHPTYLTVLALAYARKGDLESAIVIQKRALTSPRFPPSYREEATNQLHEYERAVAESKRMQ